MKAKYTPIFMLKILILFFYFPSKILFTNSYFKHFERGWCGDIQNMFL